MAAGPEQGDATSARSILQQMQAVPGAPASLSRPVEPLRLNNDSVNCGGASGSGGSARDRRTPGRRCRLQIEPGATASGWLGNLNFDGGFKTKNLENQEHLSHKFGRRPRACVLALRPLPPTHPRPTPTPVDFARGVKKQWFLRCFGPFCGHGFYLGDVPKPCFLRGFGLQDRSRGGKIGILRWFQHRWRKKTANIAPT